MHQISWYNQIRGDTMFDFFNENEYAAVIGDIIGSKESSDRYDVQQKMKKVLKYINDTYQEHLASEFMITLGDEFQGLLKDRKMIIGIINDIEMAMLPIKIRFGIGIGAINTEINYKRSIEVDGPAYNRARKMIERLEERNAQYEEIHFNIMICSGKENENIDQLLNSVFSVCCALKRNWSKRQIEIINAFIIHDENQYKTAEALHIGQSSVSRALKKANYYTYKFAMKNLNDFLSEERHNLND